MSRRLSCGVGAVTLALRLILCPHLTLALCPLPGTLRPSGCCCSRKAPLVWGAQASWGDETGRNYSGRVPFGLISRSCCSHGHWRPFSCLMRDRKEIYSPHIDIATLGPSFNRSESRWPNGSDVVRFVFVGRTHERVRHFIVLRNAECNRTHVVLRGWGLGRGRQSRSEGLGLPSQLHLTI